MREAAHLFSYMYGRAHETRGAGSKGRPCSGKRTLSLILFPRILIRSSYPLLLATVLSRTAYQIRAASYAGLRAGYKLFVSPSLSCLPTNPAGSGSLPDQLRINIVPAVTHARTGKAIPCLGESSEATCRPLSVIRRLLKIALAPVKAPCAPRGPQ